MATQFIPKYGPNEHELRTHPLVRYTSFTLIKTWYEPVSDQFGVAVADPEIGWHKEWDYVTVSLYKTFDEANAALTAAVEKIRATPK